MCWGHGEMAQSNRAALTELTEEQQKVANYRVPVLGPGIVDGPLTIGEVVGLLDRNTLSRKEENTDDVLAGGLSKKEDVVILGADRGAVGRSRDSATVQTMDVGVSLKLIHCITRRWCQSGNEGCTQ